MKKYFFIIIFTVSVFYTPANSYAQSSPSCDDELDHVKNWDDLYRWYGLYDDCRYLGGEVGESLSDIVPGLFASDWSHFSHVAVLARKDPGFRDFVLSHLDQVSLPGDLLTAKDYARKECPPKAKGLCRQVIKEVDQILAEDRADLTPHDDYDFGMSFAQGVVVKKNMAEAAKWWRSAGEKGDMYAQYELGALYESGQGVSQNYAEAAKWYRLAAAQGHMAAYNALGGIYDMGGHGLEKNGEEAYFWYTLAKNANVSGFSSARYAAVGNALSADQISAVQKRVTGWKPPD